MTFKAKIDNGKAEVAGNVLQVLEEPPTELYPGMVICFAGFNTDRTQIIYDTAFGEFAGQTGGGVTYPVTLVKLLTGQAKAVNSTWLVDRSTLLKAGTATRYPIVTAGPADIVDSNLLTPLTLFRGLFNVLNSTDGNTNRLLWNADGWDTEIDLQNIASRQYQGLSMALRNNIQANAIKTANITDGSSTIPLKVGNVCIIREPGNVNWYAIGGFPSAKAGDIFIYNGNDLSGTGSVNISAQLIMKDTTNSKYYLVQFTNLGASGTGSVQYFRNLVDPDYVNKADRIKINVGSYYQFANLTVGAGNTISTVNINTTNFVANTTIDDYYVGMTLKVLNGTGVNIATIVSYNSISRIATVSPELTNAPTGTSNILIYSDGVMVKSIVGVTGSTLQLNNFAGIHTSKSNLLYEILPTLNVVEYEIVKTGYVAD